MDETTPVQNPATKKRKGKMGIIITVILVLVVGGVAIWGGTSGLFQGAAFSFCGNNKVDKSEQCDDGNKLGKDGCSEKCQVEKGWTCNLNNEAKKGMPASICKKDKTLVPTKTGTTTTPAPKCGNGVIEGTEKCDDGNNNSNDGCSSTCTIELPSTIAVEDTIPAENAVPSTTEPQAETIPVSDTTGSPTAAQSGPLTNEAIELPQQPEPIISPIVPVLDNPFTFTNQVGQNDGMILKFKVSNSGQLSDDYRVVVRVKDVDMNGLCGFQVWKVSGNEWIAVSFDPASDPNSCSPVSELPRLFNGLTYDYGDTYVITADFLEGNVTPGTLGISLVDGNGYPVTGEVVVTIIPKEEI